jgi:hypothetical protein
MGTDDQSVNWSGYDVTGGPFTSATATWTQPAVKASGDTFSAVGIWVGLDGDGSGTVEQIGTVAYSEGTVGYAAWYEMYPGYPVTIGMSIHPGDLMTGAVTWIKPATFILSLVNHTTGRSYQTTQFMSVPPALASAEVIVEAPGAGDRIVPLADFTLCTFTDCAIDGRPLSAYDWNRIDMVTWQGDLKDRALALGEDGTSFSVTTDLIPPQTTVVGGQVRLAGWHNLPVTMAFKATDNATGVKSTEYSTDAGATWTTAAAVTVDAPDDHSADGAHDVLYRSTDNVGNLESDKLVRLRIDTQRPTPGGTRDASVARGQQAPLRYRVDDPRPGSFSATVTILVRNGQGTVVHRALLRNRPVNTALVYRFAAELPRGRYTYSVKATDAAGNRQTAVAQDSLVVR